MSIESANRLNGFGNTDLDVRESNGRELVRVVAGVLGLRVGVVDKGLDLVVDVDGGHGSDAQWEA